MTGLFEQERVTVYHSASPEQTRALGEAVGRLADAGDVIALTGELGTGKTLFVGGLARGLGVDPAAYVSSPTFTIMHRHRGRLPLYHLDLYRIETPEAFASLGLDEYLEGDGVAAIEWPEHGWGCLPKEMLLFRLQYTGSDTRSIEIVPIGDRYMKLVQALTGDFLAASGCLKAST
ncbi:tRNA (adenosine(37)-N6)-threonylcarbamoyltransferase complex ATPase subunit type 1 TsaE [Candidatus Methylomirabilis sp.]|uniref:tRNA (adenosine(37)-N6)-threonylcarbamoyltransferase complex ATPase subunit type 1 TsaE n=1 Tax=Candidatus Methylomirabilis sp. TaxID=2032687 RepID=UPI002A5D8433|nr:tRNA (adenosine(37)-N6)-threonylcarbamoyltransferase complex ATPase subunit type 1 TsaE [Candidatus Methylomirabilis sp.]